jgi:hypothetical protein
MIPSARVRKKNGLGAGQLGVVAETVTENGNTKVRVKGDDGKKWSLQAAANFALVEVEEVGEEDTRGETAGPTLYTPPPPPPPPPPPSPQTRKKPPKMPKPPLLRGHLPDIDLVWGFRQDQDAYSHYTKEAIIGVGLRPEIDHVFEIQLLDIAYERYCLDDRTQVHWWGDKGDKCVIRAARSAGPTSIHLYTLTPPTHTHTYTHTNTSPPPHLTDDHKRRKRPSHRSIQLSK